MCSMQRGLEHEGSLLKNNAEIFPWLKKKYIYIYIMGNKPTWGVFFLFNLACAWLTIYSPFYSWPLSENSQWWMDCVHVSFSALVFITHTRIDSMAWHTEVHTCAQMECKSQTQWGKEEREGEERSRWEGEGRRDLEDLNDPWDLKQRPLLHVSFPFFSKAKKCSVCSAYESKTSWYFFPRMPLMGIFCCFNLTASVYFLPKILVFELLSKAL